MRVAAVIPNWNRSALLARLLDNLKEQTRAFDRIVVVDNGSSDESREAASCGGAEVIALASNLGFAGAVNAGIRAIADCEWIAILNNDVELEADWLEEMLREVPSGAWFSSGKILAARDRSVLDGAFDALSRAACAYRCGAGKPDATVWNQPRTIWFAPMTAALFRRELFEEIGPLDQTFGSYLEDVDFGFRCAVAGRHGVYVPSAIAHHEGSATLGMWNKDTVRLISRNQVLLVRKHLAGQPLWPILAGQLLWGFVALRHGRVCAYLQGKASGLRLSSKVIHGHPYPSQRVRELLEASEREILAIQRQTGFDTYWRMYFWLVRR